MIFLQLFIPALVFLQASCTSSISSFLTAPYTAWFPIVALAVVCATGVVIVVYTIAPLIGNFGSVRSWARLKIYELLTSLILIFLFATIATALCTTDPTGALSSVGLISSSCTGSSTNSTINASSANIYSVSLCNLYQFNTYVLHFSEYFYLIQVRFSTQLSYAVNFQASVPGVGSVTGQSGGFGLAPGTGEGGGVGSFGGILIPASYLFILLNQIQLILLSAAPLIFAIFMAIGLISRAFGVARSFGGAMIAFGLGIGFIYPLLIAVNYGFIDHGLEQAAIFGTGAATIALPTYSPIAFYATVVAAYFTGSSLLAYLPEYFFVYVGLIFMGVVFIDVFNFVILDVFITDFSQSIGEKMSFLSLLSNIV